MKEGRDLPTFLSPPLIKIRVFNWSKLIFYISFVFIRFYLFFFIFFLFSFVALSALYSFVESLLLVNMPLDSYQIQLIRIDNELIDYVT